jgi:hypothetical protein
VLAVAVAGKYSVSDIDCDEAIENVFVAVVDNDGTSEWDPVDITDSVREGDTKCFIALGTSTLQSLFGFH